MNNKINNDKRICFISLGHIDSVPYINNYIKAINCNFDIIYWDRGLNGSTEHYQNKYIVKRKISQADSKWEKMAGYFYFRANVLKILRKNKYSCLINLSSNTALLLWDVLVRKYKKKYVIDVRDYFYEHYKIVFLIEELLMKYAGIAVISSKAYQNFLPPKKYLVMHNYCEIESTIRRNFMLRDKRNNNPIRVSYIGFVRFLEQNKLILNYFANDDRFVIQFFGANSESLERYCKENSIKNVNFHGFFDPKDTVSFYEQSDVVLNMYGNKSPWLDYALSNKLYYAASLGLPIVTSPNTYMETVVLNQEIGISLDLSSENEKERLIEYYRSINWSDFYNKCNAFISLVCKENSDAIDVIKNFLLVN